MKKTVTRRALFKTATAINTKTVTRRVLLVRTGVAPANTPIRL
jgi:hypothetical protein